MCVYFYVSRLNNIPKAGVNNIPKAGVNNIPNAGVNKITKAGRYFESWNERADKKR